MAWCPKCGAAHLSTGVHRCKPHVPELADHLAKVIREQKRASTLSPLTERPSHEG